MSHTTAGRSLAADAGARKNAIKAIYKHELLQASFRVNPTQHSGLKQSMAFIMLMPLKKTASPAARRPPSDARRS